MSGVDQGQVGPGQGVITDQPAAEPLPEPQLFESDGHTPVVDPREAAAEAVRAVMAEQQKESDDAEEAEAEAAPETEAEAVQPAEQVETDEQPEGGRVKPSILREAQRRQKAAQRAEAEARALREEIAREREQMRRELEEVRQFREAAKRDPWAATAQATGLSREQLLAMGVDGQADAIPPTVAAELTELRQTVQQMREERERERQQMQEQAQRARSEDLIGQDVKAFEDMLSNGHGDKYPHAAALHPQRRAAIARQLVEQAAQEMARLRDPDLYTRTDILEALDERAREEVEYYRTRLGAAPASAPSPDKLAAAPAAQPGPKRAAKGLSARDAATPAARGPMSWEESRDAAAAAVRDLVRSGQ